MNNSKLIKLAAAAALFQLPVSGHAAALPDLAATDLGVNAECQVVVKFRNNGPGVVPDAAFALSPPGSSVQMYKDNQPWGGIVLGGIDPQKHLKPAGGTLTHTWFPGAANLKLPPGTHSVRVVVDNNNVVKESNEQNNTLTRRLTCRQPLPDLVPIKLGLNAACQIVVTLKNNGPGAVPAAAYGTNPPGSSVQMYSDNQPWGGIVLIGVDPQKQLVPAGGTVTHTWFPGAANLKLSPGTHSVKIVVDKNNVVAEGNEQNNTLAQRLTCGKIGGLKAPEKLAPVRQ
jgi:hypothetical protein